MTGRVALGALGAGIGLYGAWLLVSRQSSDQLLSVALWLGGAVAVHDFVLAPATIGVGWLLVRWAPPGLRAPVALTALVLGSLTVLAIPVLGAWGRRADNPSLLDRDYLSGWLLVAAIVSVGTALVTLAALLPRRPNL